MHQAVRQLTVVGQQQQTFGVGIQTSDVKQLLVPANPVLDQVPHARATPIVRHRGVHPLGLVDRQMHQRVIDGHPRTVDPNHGDVGVHAGAQLGHYPVVNLYAAVEDHLLGYPARRNSGLRQHLLEPHALGISHPRPDPR